MQSTFQISHLSLFYGAFQALKDITMDVSRNQVTALIGPSGCGKSTFLRTLNRMNDLIDGVRIEGYVGYEGRNLYTDFSPIDLRTRVGMVFQKPNPFPMTVFENIAYGPRLHGVRNKQAIEERVEKSLRAAAVWDELKDRLHTPALSLSGGQQQRVCIARALAVEPDVLLMDEPTSALDPISTGKIESLVEALKEQYTIVIVTHNMQQAGRVSDYTAFFMVDEHKSGYVAEYGTTVDMFFNPQNAETEAYISGRFG
ncbi:MAG: phosphate ABC transporter ATP-binding protein PstB [Spirochaetota bacterium]